MKILSARHLWTGLLLLFVMGLVSCGDSSRHAFSTQGSSDAAITSFSFTPADNPQLPLLITGVIDEAENIITLIGPFDPDDVDGLKASFTLTGASVSVSGIPQQSGATPNNFANPLIYRVTAQNGSTRDYTVRVVHWQHPSSLDDAISPAGKDVYAAPKIAMNGSGDTVIVWQQRDSANALQIFMSEYRNGVWTHPVDINDSISPSGGQGAYEPAVAMDRDGNTVIAWSQNDGGPDGGDSRIYKSEYRNGTWTHPASLNDYFSPGASVAEPEVAMDDIGNAIIVWTSWNSSDNRIYMSEYRSGTWIHPADASDYLSTSIGNIFELDLAMSNNGDAILVWRQWKSTPDGNQIYKSEYRSGAWTHPASLASNISPNGRNAWRPRAAMDDAGNTIIAWYAQDLSGINQVFKSEYRSSTWLHPNSPSDNISPDGQTASSPEVAMDKNGNALITWYQHDGTNYQIFMSEYRSGAWHHPSSLADNISPDGQNAFQSRIALGNNGNAIITWYQHDGTNYQVFKSEYWQGIWLHPDDLADNISPDGQDATAPLAVMDDSGNAIIAWYQPDGATTQVFASELRR